MKKIKSIDLDEKFDNNDDISEFMDWENAKRVDDALMRVSVDFPKWMVISLDKEASHLGLSRQALIKLSVADHIKQKSYSA